MHRPSALITLGACLLALVACDKTPTSPPAPKLVQPAAPTTGATADAAGVTSVPSAETVFAPANAAKADPTPERSNSAMSAAQESTAMPMPGQNNDHSAPIRAARRASAP